MKLFELKTGTFYCSEDRQTSIEAKLYIDRKLIADSEKEWLTIDLLELEKTIKSDGEYFIITCICGNPDCAGITQVIKVWRDTTTIHWKDFSHYPEKQYYRFDFEDYKHQINNALKQLSKLIKANPEIETTPTHMKCRVMQGISQIEDPVDKKSPQKKIKKQ
jgi:hypothetical protein